VHYSVKKKNGETGIYKMNDCNDILTLIIIIIIIIIITSQVSFPLVLLLNQWCTAPLKIQVLYHHHHLLRRFPFPWYSSSWTSGALHHSSFKFYIIIIIIIIIYNFSFVQNLYILFYAFWHVVFMCYCICTVLCVVFFQIPSHSHCLPLNRLFSISTHELNCCWSLRLSG
jgi:hypothetical protein